MYFTPVLCLIAATFAYVHSQNPETRYNVILKNPHSGLVITENEGKNVTVNYFKNHDHQIWHLEPTLKGTYFIISKASGKALQKPDDSKYMITDRFSECRDQQWHFNSNNTFHNAEHGLFLDIKNAIYEEGTLLLAFENRGSANQVFEVVDLDEQN